MIDFTREGFIQSLRDAADFFEANNAIIVPKWQQDINCFATNDELAKQEARNFAKAFGKAEKEYGDTLFEMSKHFGAGIRVRFLAHREAVCERVVLDRKIVPAFIVPAREGYTEPERVEEVVEWRCEPITAGGAA